MANRPVIKWPDPVLKKVCLPVAIDEFGDDLENFVRDMCDTVDVQMGAGLAAPQIGVSRKVVILKATDFVENNPDPYEKDENILVLINPDTTLSGDDVSWEEGCLSLPGYTAQVTRKSIAHVAYQDLHGNQKELTAEWPLSGGIQHECDHLIGKLFIDRASRLVAGSIRKKMLKRIKDRKRHTKALRRETLVDIHGEAAVRKMERPPKRRNKKSEKLKKLSRKNNRKK
jgi:peptide deformylase